MFLVQCSVFNRPYYVFNKQGYSKHYYAGAERVSSRIGGGIQDALVDPLNYTVQHPSGHDDYNQIAAGLYGMLSRSIECTDMPLQYVSMEQQLVSIEDSRNHNNTEDNRYIYHSDHLGSSAFLTDIDGNPTQHLQYLPFGEPFIEQRSVTDYYTPYTFSAKEGDLETGYSYFGARYYNSHISVWLSVDPLSDKYPGMSAYMYCAGNPVMLVDPDGKDIILVGEDGTQITYHMGMTYEGSDKTLIAMINSLNSIVSTNSGFPVVAELVNSSNNYTIMNEDGITTSDLPSFCANNATEGKSGGQIITRSNNTISSLSHELFHAYQDELGQGGASIHNEVEAYVFQSRVVFQVMFNTGRGTGLPLFLLSQSRSKNTDLTQMDKQYESAVNQLTTQGFDKSSFNTAVNLFKSHSASNNEGNYNSYPIQRLNQTKRLLKQIP